MSGKINGEKTYLLYLPNTMSCYNQIICMLLGTNLCTCTLWEVLYVHDTQAAGIKTIDEPSQLKCGTMPELSIRMTKCLQFL